MRLAATLARARFQINAGRADGAESLLARARSDAAAQRDTAALCRVARYLARREEARGRWTEALAQYELALRFARRARLPFERGWAELGLATGRFEAGAVADAEAGYRRAIASFERAGEGRGIMRARAGLARSLQTLGLVDEARRQHTLTLSDARRERDVGTEADTHANLGSLELTSGDPTRATAHLRDALALYERLGRRDRVMFVSRALAIQLINATRLDEADSVLSRVRTEGEHSRDASIRARFLSQLGVLRRQQRRYVEAAELGRAAVSLSDSLTIADAVEVTTTLKATYSSMDQPAVALALLEAQIERFRSRAPGTALFALERQRAPLLRQLGRARDALPIVQAAAREMGPAAGGNAGAQQLLALSELARCYSDLGQADSAVAVFARVAVRWEAWRGTSEDPGWREQYDDFARRFSGESALALLDPRRQTTEAVRVSEAFEALQRFRARTLEERIRGPGPSRAAASHATPLRSLQRQVLLPGEALVDLHFLPETTLVFVMTRDTLHVHGAPRSSALVPRLDRMRALFSDPTSEGSELMISAPSALGAALFGPAADLLRPARRILLACGSLSRLPLEMTEIPGESGALSKHREVARIPSATRLAAARAMRPPVSAKSILAVAQSSRPGGPAMAAADHEALWLSRRFAGADALTGAAAPNAAAVTSRVERYQVLHLAAHTRSGGDRPWQDAILVGSGRGEDAWLTASRIAALHLPGTLCVLAGCNTLGEQDRSGETLEGIGPACLAAGARAAIVTLWKVDDEATFALMKPFYEGLARGENAGAALRSAQQEVQRTGGRAHPYYWAGVVLLGDPEVRVTLRPR